MDGYDPQQIEAKWQRVWEAEGAFHEPNPAPARRPTSATGISWRCSRTRRGRSTWGTSSTTRWATSRRTCADGAAGACCGRWVSTRSACPPRTPRSATASIRESTERYIVLMREQMKRLGWAIDWDREVSAHQPEFYRWTQWLFLKFFERGLAYRRRRRSTGARTTRRSSRTSTSSTAAASVAERKWRRGTSSSGSSRSPTMPTSCSSTTCPRAATGRSGRRRSSATGSGARRARRSCSASTS